MQHVKYYSFLQADNMAFMSLLFGVIEMVGSELSYIVFLHQTTTQCRRPERASVLSYIVFLHQTTTRCIRFAISIALSYIVFLHQTTTKVTIFSRLHNCLISSFYIKPQLYEQWIAQGWHCLISSFYIKPQQ